MCYALADAQADDLAQLGGVAELSEGASLFSGALVCLQCKTRQLSHSVWGIARDHDYIILPKLTLENRLPVGIQFRLCAHDHASITDAAVAASRRPIWQVVWADDVAVLPVRPLDSDLFRPPPHPCPRPRMPTLARLDEWVGPQRPSHVPLPTCHFGLVTCHLPLPTSHFLPFTVHFFGPSTVTWLPHIHMHTHARTHAHTRTRMHARRSCGST